jgi:hypothetical protein
MERDEVSALARDWGNGRCEFFLAGRNFWVISFVHSQGCNSTSRQPEALTLYPPTFRPPSKENN